MGVFYSLSMWPRFLAVFGRNKAVLFSRAERRDGTKSLALPKRPALKRWTPLRRPPADPPPTAPGTWKQTIPSEREGRKHRSSVAVVREFIHSTSLRDDTSLNSQPPSRCSLTPSPTAAVKSSIGHRGALQSSPPPDAPLLSVR